MIYLALLHTGRGERIFARMYSAVFCKITDYFRKLFCYFQITHFFCYAEREVRILIQAES